MTNKEQNVKQNTERLMHKLCFFLDNLENEANKDRDLFEKIVRLENEMDIALDEMKDLLYNARTLVIDVVGQGKKSINISEILYVESQKHCVLIHTNNGIKKSNNSLVEIGLMLQNEAFYRCHKSYIVNMNEIEAYVDNLIYMNNGEKVYISRRKLTEFKKLYINSDHLSK